MKDDIIKVKLNYIEDDIPTEEIISVYKDMWMDYTCDEERAILCKYLCYNTNAQLNVSYKVDLLTHGVHVHIRYVKDDYFTSTTIFIDKDAWNIWSEEEKLSRICEYLCHNTDAYFSFNFNYTVL